MCCHGIFKHVGLRFGSQAKAYRTHVHHTPAETRSLTGLQTALRPHQGQQAAPAKPPVGYRNGVGGFESSSQLLGPDKMGRGLRTSTAEQGCAKWEPWQIVVKGKEMARPEGIQATAPIQAGRKEGKWGGRKERREQRRQKEQGRQNAKKQMKTPIQKKTQPKE